MRGYDMAIKVPRGEKDSAIQQIMTALRDYEAEHKKAKIDVYRQNNVSVRIRIIDPSFRAMNKSSRHAKVWQLLEKLPLDVLSDVTMLLLLTPEETKMSFANFEFEDPVSALD